jgi:hypothetical protein
MKFRMIHLGYRQTPDYPYDYRIELVEYGTVMNRPCVTPSWQ